MGASREYWRVDVQVRLPSGEVQRVTRVPRDNTKNGAERLERELIRAILDGSLGQAKRKVVPTVEAFSREFLDTYAKTHNKPSEQYAKEVAFRRWLLPFFGATRLDQVKLKEVERFKAAQLEEKLAPKTINNHLNVLRRMLAVAVEWELVGAGDVPKFKQLKAPKPPFDFLTFEEAERLIAAAEEPWRTQVLVALKTGLRHGELLALRWSDLDLVAGRLVVRRSLWRRQFVEPKSGRHREVPLGDDVLHALKAHRHLQGELVFCIASGKLLTAKSCVRPLFRACKRAGLRPVQWHVLRHTFASHLVMRGAPLKVVQELLGHATVEMTMRYAHLAPVALRDAVKLLDAHPADTAATNERKHLKT